MADIFISYSQKDRGIVAPLAAFLESQGYDLWWDSHLTGGAEFRAEIKRQIAAARAVVVVWSANSIASNFVLDEADVAANASKLVPVREASFSPNDIPMGFRQYHAEVVSDRDAVLRALEAKGVMPLQAASETGAATAGNVAKPRWMWWSTHESIEIEVPSVCAIVETVLAVVVYWLVAVWFETYAILLAGVFVAPMVLLRSEQSIQLGHRLFERWELKWRTRYLTWGSLTSSQRLHVSAVALLAMIVGSTCAYALSSNLIDLIGGWPLLDTISITWVGFAAGAAVIGAGEAIGAGVLLFEIARLLPAALKHIIVVLLGIPYALAFTFIIFLVSLVIRLFAVLLNLNNGIKSMPRNFRRLMFSTSPLQSPELLPDLSRTESVFRLDRWISFSGRAGWIERFGLIVLLAYIPAWLYRISIKSTAWFWWPLAYIGREPHEARDPEHMRHLIQGSPFRRLGRWVAFAFLLAFALVNGWDHIVPAVQANGFALPALPEHSFVVAFLLTRPTDIPWQAFGLASATIALLVGMWTSHAAIGLDWANRRKDLSALVRAGRPFPWIERLARLGFLCTVPFWLGLAGHLALTVNAQRCWIDPPPTVAAWAKSLYGDLAPPPPRCAPVR